MKRVAIVILNWNGKKFLEKFLPSVVDNNIEYADIYIADNASTDDSLSFLEANYPKIHTIPLDKNYGFAEGYNRALKQIVDIEYFILLNSDIEVTPGWIEPVINFLDNNNDYVACQPKLLSYYDRTQFEYAGAAGGFLDKFGYPFCRGRIFNHVETDNGQFNNYCEIFWATGACMFVRAQEYHEIGGFDKDFFAHMEEIDLCWRFKNAGFKIGYCPTSVVYHVGGGTLPKSSSFKTYLNIRNNEVMIYKNLTSKRLIPVMLLRFCMDLVSSIKFFIDGGFKDFWAVIRAHLSFFKHFGRNKHKRKHIDQQTISCMYTKSIVFQNYFKKKNYFNQLDKKDFTANS